MGQEKIEIDDSKSSTNVNIKSSSTLEMAKELGISINKESSKIKDDLGRLELIIDNKAKKESKKSIKKSKKCLTNDNLTYITKALFDEKNKHILQQLLENIETTTSNFKAKTILECIDKDDKTSNNINLNINDNKDETLEPELVELFSSSSEIVANKEENSKDSSKSIKIEQIEDRKKELAKDTLKEESKDITLSSNSVNNEDANDLLKLILDETPSSTVEQKNDNSDGNIIESIPKDSAKKENFLNEEKDEIKIDKYYVVDKNDNSTNKAKVTPEDIDKFLSKKVTYEKEEDKKSYTEVKSINKTNYEYKEFSAIFTILKAIIYPILALSPLVIIAWLKGKLHFSQNYLNQIEPYRNDILRFFNNYNIDMKLITYLVLGLIIVLSILFIISFLKRLLGHFKNSKMITDKRFNYVASKSSILFTYIKTITLITFATALFIATAYAILYFTQGTINLNEINIQASINSSLEWIKNLLI